MGWGMRQRDLIRRIEALEAEQRLRKQSSIKDPRVQEATRDAYTWVTQHTETYNEHWVEEGRPSPYEPFPQYPYIASVFEILDLERIVWFEKSRDMMLSWTCVAYLRLSVMKVPQRTTLFQTQTEKKAVQLIDYAKCLYRRQNSELQAAFPLRKNINDQPALELHFTNGSSIIGIPGGADQIRSFHPWGYLLDEASFVTDAGECYNEALSAVRGKIMLNSSAGPGWYADACRDIVRSQEE
jgi:hypothetical protein